MGLKYKRDVITKSMEIPPVLEENHRCGLCPTTPEAIARLPPPPLNDPPLSHFRCGHSAHTHCLFNFVYDDSINDLQCPICQSYVVTPEAREHYRGWGRRQREGERARGNLQELWDTNAEFKADILDYKAISRKFGKASKLFSPQLREIKQRFKQNVLTSVELIKMQKRQALRDVQNLESNRLYKSAGSKLERKIRNISQKYNIERWAMEDQLANVTGAPKIARHRYYRWRCASYYLFRIRI